MGLTVVDVEKEGTGRLQDSVGLPEAGLEEAHVVVMSVIVAAPPDDFGTVASTLEARAVAVLVALDSDTGTILDLAGVERRIDVDQRYAPGIHFLKNREVVRENDAAAGSW